MKSIATPFFLILAWCCGCDDAHRRDPVPVELGAAPAEQTLATTGTVEADYLAVVVPQQDADLSSAVDGRLTAVPVAVGSDVEESEVVAVLDNPDLGQSLAVSRAAMRTARAAVDEANGHRDATRRRRKRAEKLGDFVSQAEREESNDAAVQAAAQLDARLGELAGHRARVDQLEQRLDALQVRAPFAGTISAHYQSRGQNIVAKTPIVRLISHAVVIRFAVPQAKTSDFSPGTRIELVTEPHGKVVTATIQTVSPEADAASMVILEALPDDPGAVQPGTSARARLAT